MVTHASRPAADQRARAAQRFGRFAAGVAVLGLLVAVALSLPGSWSTLGRHDDRAAPTTYAEPTPADPVRLAVGGVSGVQLVAPLVRSPTGPRRALAQPPDDAPLVTWWSGSAEAGAPHGQTILLAHAGPDGGALTEVARLAAGDLVQLLTRRGSVRYTVASVRTLDPATLRRAGTSLFEQDGGAGRLVMLSAEGWDGATYRRTVVVTATPLGRPVG